MKRKLFLFVALLFGAFLTGSAQQLAIKNNLMSDLNGALNAGLEYALGQKSTLDLTASVRPWNRSERHVNRYWLVQPEYRYWTCQKFNGHFFGAYMNGAQYNVGGKKLPFGLFPALEQHRYAGWMAGAGLSYGYHFMLDKHWNIEAAVSAGYEYIHYKKYRCPVLCATEIDKGNYHYVGPTRLSLSILYLF